MKEIYTVIRKQPMLDIISGKKKIEYRDKSEYWQSRFKNIQTPFIMRLRNGYNKDAKEISIVIKKIVITDCYELHIDKVFA